jgi:hypothetical protein
MPVVFGESSLKILPLAGLLVQLVVCVIVDFSGAAQVIRVRNAKVKNEISKMRNCRFAAVTSSILHFAL